MSDTASAEDSLTDLAPARLEPHLRTARYGRSRRFSPATGSTNDDARAAAASGAADGHLELADRQTRGRGSSGRSWSSPGGQDLFLSIVDRPALAIAHLPPLTLAVGLGVAQAVESLRGEPLCTQVKWPNDVLLRGKKCAGILVEASSCGSALDAVVIGIGLNVNRLQFEPELQGTATSLRAEARDQQPLDRAWVLGELLARVEAQVDRFVALGPARIVAELAPRLAWIGKPARCGDVSGEVAGVNEAGALLLRTPHGLCELYAGRLVALDG